MALIKVPDQSTGKDGDTEMKMINLNPGLIDLFSNPLILS